ncbi:hypothetical protein QZH41_012028 [Actinostola sp. cb2023]|nr:hypothetical protein QZH41_012028 [Actinostola sp. cb2023]
MSISLICILIFLNSRTMAASSTLAYHRLAVFGATGPTGVLAVKTALELGHHVTALVRNPDKLNGIKSNVYRIVTITSWCTEKEPGNPKFMEWFLKPLFLNAYLNDMRIMERMLEQYHYQATRTFKCTPPEHSSPGSTGIPFIFKYTNAKKNYKLAEGQYLDGVSWTIPRADVADSTLKVLQITDWDKKAVSIGCN